ncbi:MAG: NADH-quinone oxidoreductase subunit A [Bradymonadaceae bacterium]
MEAYGSLTAAALTVLATWWIVEWWGRGTEPASSPWAERLPVLGGSEPPTHAWSRFHPRYYPMTLLLIAFEMEMMFMYPWAVVYVRKGMMAFAEMGMFLGILSLGILYGWREGAFRWQ